MGIGLTQQASLYDRRGDSRIARRQRPRPANAPGESEKTIVYCTYGVHVGCLLNKPDTQKVKYQRKRNII